MGREFAHLCMSTLYRAAETGLLWLQGPIWLLVHFSMFRLISITLCCLPTCQTGNDVMLLPFHWSVSVTKWKATWKCDVYVTADASAITDISKSHWPHSNTMCLFPFPLQSDEWTHPFHEGRYRGGKCLIPSHTLSCSASLTFEPENLNVQHSVRTAEVWEWGYFIPSCEGLLLHSDRHTSFLFGMKLFL